MKPNEALRIAREYIDYQRHGPAMRHSGAEMDALDAVVELAKLGAAVDLRWTNETPKVAGWYWHRDPTNSDVAQVVHVYAIEGELLVRAAGWWGALRMFPGGQWAGPIQEPEESLEAAEAAGGKRDAK